jgi:16S rRNA C967 or C1407 C5-methylase (RsmB/RsmF family)
MRLMDGFRPAKHPLHARGSIYSMDFSSVFAASLMLAILEPPRRILDLCSAPGGKAVFASLAFKPELLVCNEVIRKRTGSLIDNLERCKIENVYVASADSSVWAKKARDQFDLIIVDAPCSGQSLIAKGNDAPGCFHPTMIDMNHSRQRRILGNAYHALQPGGHILYMTCTYTKKENEKVIEWLLKQHEDLEAVERVEMNAFRSKYAEFPCYRIFPQEGIGAGAFSCLVKKRGVWDGTEIATEELPVSWNWKTGRLYTKQSD